MPLEFVRCDITQLRCNAVVKAVKRSLLGGCRTGRAKLCTSGRFPCKYEICTVGPQWQGGEKGELSLLAGCYREALELAEAHGCQSIAFPLICADLDRFPKEQAFRVAVDTITQFLRSSDMQVYLAVQDRSVAEPDEATRLKLDRYLRSRWDPKIADIGSAAGNDKPLMSPRPKPSRRVCMLGREPLKSHHDVGYETALEPMESCPDDVCESGAEQMKLRPAAVKATFGKLAGMLERLDEGFSQSLLRLIDEKGMTDSQCYKKANVDRKLFSKIRGNPDYRPSKPTVLAFAIALELDLEQTELLLRKAGFALSPSSKFDVIIEYFILCGRYDIYQINEALFAYDQPLLGA